MSTTTAQNVQKIMLAHVTPFESLIIHNAPAGILTDAGNNSTVPQTEERGQD